MSGTAVRDREDPQLLAQIERAAAQADLGAHRSAHAAVHPEHRKNMQFLGIATPVLVLATVIGIAVNGNWWFLTGIFAVGFALALVGNVIKSRPYYDKNRGVRLDLYARGLVYTQASGLRVVRYDRTSLLHATTDYHRVGEKRVVRTAYCYDLVDLDGSEFRMDGILANPQDWSRAIQDGVSEAQVPSTWAALEAGSRVEFGDVWMTRTELGYRGKSTPWSWIQRVSVQKGVVVVDVTGGGSTPPTVAVSRIRNFGVFFTLAERLCTMSGHESPTR